MQFDNQRLPGNGGNLQANPPGLLVKILAVLIGGAVLVGAFVVSLFMLAVVLVAAVLFGGYVWWKTRELRRQLRARVDERAGERVAEGEVIEDVEFHDVSKR